MSIDIRGRATHHMLVAGVLSPNRPTEDELSAGGAQNTAGSSSSHGRTASPFASLPTPELISEALKIAQSRRSGIVSPKNVRNPPPSPPRESRSSTSRVDEVLKKYQKSLSEVVRSPSPKPTTSVRASTNSIPPLNGETTSRTTPHGGETKRISPPRSYNGGSDFLAARSSMASSRTTNQRQQMVPQMAPEEVRQGHKRLEDEIKRKDEAIVQLEAKIKTTEEIVPSLYQENTQLEQQVEELKAQLTAEQEAKRVQGDEVMSLQAELLAITAEVKSEMKKAQEQYEDDLSEASAVNGQLTDQVLLLSETVTSQKDEIEKLRAAILELAAISPNVPQ